MAMIHKYTQVDKSQFIKLYVNEVSSLFNLSKSGLKIFGYIVTNIKPINDEVYLHIQTIQKYYNYKSNVSIYRGLRELIDANIVAKSERPNIWYINPAVIFNGDRLVFIREYRLKKVNDVLE